MDMNNPERLEAKVYFDLMRNDGKDSNLWSEEETTKRFRLKRKYLKQLITNGTDLLLTTTYASANETIEVFNADVVIIDDVAYGM